MISKASPLYKRLRFILFLIKNLGKLWAIKGCQNKLTRKTKRPDMDNCKHCGRDTEASSGECWRCVGKGQQGPWSFGGSSMNDHRSYIPDEKTNQEQYKRLRVEYTD